jgi:hypothetical protein
MQISLPSRREHWTGKLVNGEGVLGLTRAFFYAGARNVAVSLWNVNDSATATLMLREQLVSLVQNVA